MTHEIWCDVHYRIWQLGSAEDPLVPDNTGDIVEWINLQQKIARRIPEPGVRKKYRHDFCRPDSYVIHFKSWVTVAKDGEKSTWVGLKPIKHGE